jgi:hypothetical protein
MAAEAPHSRCNYIYDRIIVGAVPNSETVLNILAHGVDLFVCLNGDTHYSEHLPKHVELVSFKIGLGSFLPKPDAERLVSEIIEKWRDGKTVYVHCGGGHGRAGTLGALLYGKLTGCDAVTAIQHVEACRETRADKSRLFIPTPETPKQVRLIGQILGVKPATKLPDRSDTSWLKRIRDEKMYRDGR